MGVRAPIDPQLQVAELENSGKHCETCPDYQGDCIQRHTGTHTNQRIWRDYTLQQSLDQTDVLT